jgi:hypothetical protein
MTSAPSLETLFAGPSPGIVAAILVVACIAAVVVLWTFVRLVVDPRSSDTNDIEDRPRLEWDEAGDPAYDDGYAFTMGDETD